MRLVVLGALIGANYPTYIAAWRGWFRVPNAPQNSHPYCPAEGGVNDMPRMARCADKIQKSQNRRDQLHKIVTKKTAP